jgi:hypothetical protein
VVQRHRPRPRPTASEHNVGCVGREVTITVRCAKGRRLGWPPPKSAG